MNKKLMSFLALGDSYTIGEGVQPESRWPEQLRLIMEKRTPAIGAVSYIARSGWTSGDLLSMIPAFRHDDRYDVVTLLIGANDHYRAVPVDDYRANLEALLSLGRSLVDPTSGRFLVLSIPDWTVTPFARAETSATIRPPIDAYNTVLWRTAVAFRLPYLDITPSSRLMSEQNAFVTEDGLHPAPPMYRLWAKEAAKRLLKEVRV